MLTLFVDFLAVVGGFAAPKPANVYARNGGVVDALWRRHAILRLRLMALDERLMPVRKGRPVTFELPPVETPSDITKALGTVAKGMAEASLRLMKPL